MFLSFHLDSVKEEDMGAGEASKGTGGGVRKARGILRGWKKLRGTLACQEESSSICKSVILEELLPGLLKRSCCLAGDSELCWQVTAQHPLFTRVLSSPLQAMNKYLGAVATSMQAPHPVP